MILDLRRRSGEGSPKVIDAVDEYVYHLEKSNYRPATVAAARIYLYRFAKDHGEKTVGSLSPELLAAYITLRYAKEISRDSLRKRLASWWKFCAERKWCDPMTMRRVRWEKKREDRAEIGFWKAPTVRKFMKELPPHLRPGMALAFFAGVRPEEMVGFPVGEGSTHDFLRWEDIDFGRKLIEIRSEVAKTRRGRRLFDLPPNLWAWLRAYRQPSGFVIGITKRNFAEARRKAYRKINAEWPHDCARHTFASHNFWRGYEWCIAIMGHQEGPGTFYRHYKGNTSKADLTAYDRVNP